MSVTNTYIDNIPGEDFFVKNLQGNVFFTLGKKNLKQGRLIIFKLSHFYIQFTLLSNKNNKECFEIPIPFNVEYYPSENLIYFDYRVKALAGKNDLYYSELKNCRIKNITPSQYYNKILEIKTSIP